MKAPSEMSYEGRVGLQQRVLPAYRTPFFDRLANACESGLSVFAGAARPDEGILPAEGLKIANGVAARNLHLLRAPFYLCLQLGIVDWLETWDPDALVLEANPRYLTNGKAITWMHQRSRPVIGWGLGAPPVSGSTRSIRIRARRRYLSRFDALIAYSSLGAEQYRAEGFPAERVFIAHNAVSAPPPPFLDRTPPIERSAKVLFVGRLQERKRVDLLLRACAAQDTPIDLTIVGDGPERAELERLAGDIYPRACFVGSQYGEILGSHFDRADLFVLPGTGGLAVQQAMAHGLPVIVAEGDGTQEDLVSAGNGWLVRAGDLTALTAALGEALSTPHQLLEMGLKSHDLVVERFNIDAMVEVFVRALRVVSGGS